MNYYILISTLLISVIVSFNIAAQNIEKIPCEEIAIGCRIVNEGKFVIKNDTEYQDFLQSKQSPLLKCTGNEWPVIDFAKYTVLGITVGVAGCKEPSWEYEINYIQEQNKYVPELIITQHGHCERLNHIDIWCLIPIIPENSIVDFKKIEKIVDE